MSMLLALTAPLCAWSVQPEPSALGPEPTVHLTRTPATQLRWSDDARLRALEARFGGDRWGYVFDERDGRTRFVYLSGLPVERAEELAEALAGSAELSLVDHVRDGERHTFVWHQVHDGVPLYGTELVLFAEQGRLQAARMRLARPPTEPSVADAWLPLGKQWVQAYQERNGTEVRWFDTGGRLLLAWDERRFSTLELEYETRNHLQGTTEGAVRRVRVEDADGSETTADDGSHARTDPYDVRFEGTELVLYDNYVGPSPVSVESLSGDVVLEGDADLSWAAADVFAHFWVVRDWLEDRCEDCDLLDEAVPARVNISYGTCNAYYTSGTINFFVGNGSCANLGRFADVIYHEYGHGIHHYGLEAGTFASDVSEGSADYVAATILDDTTLAPDYGGTGTWIREIDTDRVYPDDIIGESHNDGLIWASFLWNLREQWQADYGEVDGVERTDLLFLEALRQGPSLTDLGEAVILADDDDGDLTNGTPHACELWDLLDQHGLGPGAIGVVTLDHEALGPQASDTESYPVSFSLTDVTTDCSGLDPDSVRVFYTIDTVEAEVDTGVIDTGDTGAWAEPGEVTWTELALTHADDVWTGEIPRQPANAEVSYFLSVASTDGTYVLTSHDGDPEQLWSFWVGDREEIWCDDFESGGADWTTGPGTPWATPDAAWFSEFAVGTPGASDDWDPESAASGSLLMGINLAGDGYYAASNQQYVRSPAIALDGDAPMLMLSYQRWLTVEDGLYDQARVNIGEEELWSNPRSNSGDEHQLDRDWVLHDLPLSDVVEGAGNVRFTWTLASDGGLEYGGWNLDDVCIVQLAEIEEHYRGAALVASDDRDDGVSVSWENPWVQPLGAVVVVRKQGALPEDPEDGVAVAFLDDPTPGEVLEVLDEDAGAGTTYGYAVFASDGDGTWYGAAIEGEDADYGGVPSPEDTAVVDDTGDEGPPSPTIVSLREPGLPAVGCGCAANNASPVLIWLLPLVGLIGRRRATR